MNPRYGLAVTKESGVGFAYPPALSWEVKPLHPGSDVMAIDDRTLELTAELLADAEDLPWKTARYLSRRLMDKHQVAVRAPELEQALLNHAGRPLRLLRYSFFPARKTLDLGDPHPVTPVREVIAQVDHSLEIREAVRQEAPRGVVGQARQAGLSNHRCDIGILVEQDVG